MDWLRNKPLTPLLKWPGGKSTELKRLRASYDDLFPGKIERYFEPFLGGGAVWLAVNVGCPMFVNDICKDLTDFYNYIRLQDDTFHGFIAQMAAAWDTLHEIAQADWERLYAGEAPHPLLTLGGMDCDPTIRRIVVSKIKRIKVVEQRAAQPLNKEDCQANIESALKAGYYTFVRDVFNHTLVGPLRTACFYFLRDYCFSSMFRYNGEGHFNVPYGGVSYNRRSPLARVKYWKSAELSTHLNGTTFGNTDFAKFLEEHKPTERDFAFIDPPYDTDFSTYDAKEFGPGDQERLAGYLLDSPMQFLAVMKNTDRVYDLYRRARNVRCLAFSKNFAVSFRDRNNRDVRLLLVSRVSR
jgi:DNA adenine methylase